MENAIIGLLAVIIGAAFCFRGWMVLRIIIPMWGAFAGFVLGAGLVAGFSSNGFLSTVLGWVVGAAVALLFGLIAYLYYEVSVVIAMAAIGFTVTTTILAAFGISWSWVVVLAGTAAAVALGFFAIVGNLPMVLLVVLSAFAGAGTIVGGLMVLFGVVDVATISTQTTERLQDDWWWYPTHIILAVTGIVVQVRAVERLTASLRQSWVDAGGKELRTSG